MNASNAGVAADCVPEPALTDNGKVFTGPVPPSASGGAFGGLP
jgi:hypothetical protein